MVFKITAKEIEACKGMSFENVYYFVMLIYLGMANGYTQVLCYPPSKGLWTAFIPIILTIILVVRHKSKLKDSKSLLLVLFILTLWIFLQSIKYDSFEPMNLYLLYNFVMAFILCRVYGFRGFVLYEKYLTWLAALSLVVWMWYTISPSTILSVFSALTMKSYGTLMYSGFLCNISSSSDFLGIRNVGFAQEPGYWASFLIIGLFVNLLIHNFKYNNRSFFILFFALITSQSTTGYAAFGIIIITIVLASNRGRFFVVTTFVVLLPSIIALPFMGEKMEHLQYSKESVSNIQHTISYYASQREDIVFVPQRFDGFVFEATNFTHDPFLGYGMKDKNSYMANVISPKLFCSNGNIKVFSRFGLVLAILFFRILFNTGRYIVGGKYAKIKWVWMFLYLIVGMSYELTTVPLLLSFWFASFFSHIPLIGNLHINKL